jgi:hypothetical protein
VDEIFGGAGSDVTFGGPGADFLRDVPGADTIHRGPGNDYVVLVKDGTPDTVHCGPGRHDGVVGATPINTVAADCEEVHVGQPRRGVAAAGRLSARSRWPTSRQAL